MSARLKIKIHRNYDDVADNIDVKSMSGRFKVRSYFQGKILQLIDGTHSNKGLQFI